VAPRRRDDLVIVAAALLPLALFLLRERQVSGAPGFPLDDSWIHLHFARNLAEGAGFAYNPGTPVAGSTAPLWTVALSAVIVLLGPSLWVIKATGIATTVGAAFVTRRMALAWGVPAPVALATGVALLWTGAMAWGALSGMEVSLAALLVAAALLALARERTVLTASLAALAGLARPEALLLLPFLAVARPLTPRRAAVFVVTAALVLAPAVAFSLVTVGSPLPATAVAKVEGGLLGWLGGVHEPLALTFLGRPGAFLQDWGGWLWTTHWLLPFLLAPAIVAAWVRRGRALGVPALALLAHPLGMALLAPYRGPSFQEGRYCMHLLPLALVVLAIALGEPSTRWRRALVAIYLAVALVTLVPAAERYAWGVQNINAMQVHLGHWIDAHLPPTARIATNDIGAIAYFSRREITDLMGLVTPEILPYRKDGERGVLRYVVERCPDYLVIFPAWFPAIAARRDLLEPIHRVRLSRNEVAGGPEMVVYRLLRCAA
jgi:hypothetical protein